MKVASMSRPSRSARMVSSRPQLQGVLVSAVQLWIAELLLNTVALHVQFAHSARPAACSHRQSMETDATIQPLRAALRGALVGARATAPSLPAPPQSRTGAASPAQSHITCKHPNRSFLHYLPAGLAE